MSETIAPEIPEMPQEAIEFSKEVGKLADKYGIRSVGMDIRIDTGVGSKYQDRRFNEQIAESVVVHITKRDGRGRPRTQISVEAQITMRSKVEWEPDSTD